MEHEKSLLSKILMTVILPVALIFCVTAGISMVTVSQNYDQFGDIQNSLLLIYTIGLAVMVGVSVLGVKAISNRLTSLVEAVNRLADGDFEVDLNAEKPQDQLGEVAYALSGIAENIRLQSETAVKLAKGDLTVEISPSSDKDVLGNSLQEIKSSIKMVNDYLMQLPELVGKEADLDKNLGAKVGGDYKKGIEQVNRAIQTVADKRDFFQAILDAMPYRITVVDTDLKWTFINKTLQDLRV